MYEHVTLLAGPLSLLFVLSLAGALAAIISFAHSGKQVRGAAPRNDAWKVIGMGGGGTMQHPLISPHDPKLMLNACDMTGAYISRDGGDSWRMFNLRSGVSCFAFDPSDENVIYAGGSGLFRSNDKGDTWELILPDVTRNTFEFRRGDHGDYGLKSDDAAFPGNSQDVHITAIAVDDADGDTVYVAFSEGWQNTGEPRISATRDGGRTFAIITEFEQGNPVLAMVTPEKGKLVTIHRGAVGTFCEGEWTLKALENGVTFQQACSGKGKEGPVIWATSWSKDEGGAPSSTVLLSKDLGATWLDLGDALRPLFTNEEQFTFFDSLCCSTEDAAVCYAGYRGERAKRDPAADWEPPMSGGIVKTTDGGASWTLVKAEGPGPAPNAKASWQEMRMHEGGSIWFDPPRHIAVAPTKPEVAIATDLFRSYRTKDGGRSWDTITSVDCGDGQWTTTGLDVTTCYGVHFDPANVDNMFISYTDMALWRSVDHGKSWINSFHNIPREWRNTCYWVEFDPEVKDLVWSAWGGAHDLPRPKMWRRQGWKWYRGGMATSTDGGATWEITNDGIEETSVTHVLLEPDSPVGKRTLYACAYARGLYRSDDNGRTWTVKNNGIDHVDPFVWRILRTKEGALYLIVARRSAEFNTYTNDDDGALYVSTDKAESWKRLSLPEGCNGPNGLHIDPEDSQRMYLAAWGQGDGQNPDSGGGIYVTEDGAKTWRCLFDEDQHVYDVTHDPRTGRLYACGFESRAWYSDDKGETWKPIRGYNFHWGHRVIPDPLDEEKVYITTFGGSVWHGPATGDPNATEDVVTNIPKKW